MGQDQPREAQLPWGKGRRITRIMASVGTAGLVATAGGASLVALDSAPALAATAVASVSAQCDPVTGPGAANYTVSLTPTSMAYSVTFTYNNGYTRTDDIAANHADIGALFGKYGDTSNSFYAATDSALSATIVVTDSQGNPAQSGSLTFDRTTCGTPPQQKPTAALSVNPSTGDAPLKVTADASGSTGATSYNFAWGDGSSTGNQPAATATHTYNTAGDYTVTVTAKNSVGSDTASKTVKVTTAPPPMCKSDSDGSSVAWYSGVKFKIGTTAYQSYTAALTAAKPGDSITATGTADIPSGCTSNPFNALYMQPGATLQTQVLLSHGNATLIGTGNPQTFSATATLPLSGTGEGQLCGKIALQGDSGVGAVITDFHNGTYGPRKFANGYTGLITKDFGSCEQPPVPTREDVTVSVNSLSCDVGTPQATVVTKFASSIGYEPVGGNNATWVYREVPAGTYVVTLPTVAPGGSASYVITIAPLDDQAPLFTFGSYTFSRPSSCGTTPVVPQAGAPGLQATANACSASTGSTGSFDWAVNNPSDGAGTDHDTVVTQLGDTVVKEQLVDVADGTSASGSVTGLKAGTYSVFVVASNGQQSSPVLVAVVNCPVQTKPVGTPQHPLAPSSGGYLSIWLRPATWFAAGGTLLLVAIGGFGVVAFSRREA